MKKFSLLFVLLLIVALAFTSVAFAGSGGGEKPTPTPTPEKTPPPEKHECSPGFWKNHLDAWPGSLQNVEWEDTGMTWLEALQGGKETRIHTSCSSK